MKSPRRLLGKAFIGSGIILALTLGSYIVVKTVKKENPVLNFEVVEPGVLLRSGEPGLGDIEEIHEEYGIRTIICLSDDEAPEIDDFAKERGIKIVCLKMRAAEPPTEGQVDLFFEIMKDGKIRRKKYDGVIEECVGCNGGRVRFEKPVLIHCLGGSDRTGVMVALYRIQFQGWTKERAKKEMMMHFHVPFRYPAQFQFLDEFEPETLE